jgi:hypothetical protein
MTTDLDLNIEYMPVDHLIPYAKNARTHSDEQVAQIAGSMTELASLTLATPRSFAICWASMMISMYLKETSVAPCSMLSIKMAQQSIS